MRSISLRLLLVHSTARGGVSHRTTGRSRTIDEKWSENFRRYDWTFRVQNRPMTVIALSRRGLVRLVGSDLLGARYGSSCGTLEGCMSLDERQVRLLVIDEGGTCHFAVFGADSLDGLVQLLGVQRRLAADGIDSALEGSRRGGHLRVWFASPVAPDLVRRWLLPYCPAGVEFYPKQDAASFAHPGSLVRVPFGVHRLSGRRYPFLVASGAGDRLGPSARTVAASLDWIATVRRVPVPVAVPDVADVREQAGPATKKYSSKRVEVGTSSPVAPLTIQDWCHRHDALAVIG